MDWTQLANIGLPLVGSFLGYRSGQDQTTTSQLPAPMMNQWGGAANFANQVAARPYQNTVAPMTQDQYGAMDRIRNLAGGGAEQQAGSNALLNFLKGPEANPYLKGIIQQTNDEVQNRMGTSAFASGSFGNSGVAKQTADALAQNTNNVYQMGLNQTMQAIPQALNYQNQGLQNANAQLQTGAMQQQQGQNVLNNWWNYPQQQLETMMSPLRFAQGSTTTQQGNPFASALGGGLLGLQFANAWGK